MHAVREFIPGSRIASETLRSLDRYREGGDQPQHQTRTSRAGLVVSVARAESLIRSIGAGRVGGLASVALATLEYLMAVLLELAGGETSSVPSTATHSTDLVAQHRTRGRRCGSRETRARRKAPYDCGDARNTPPTAMCWIGGAESSIRAGGPRARPAYVGRFGWVMAPLRLCRDPWSSG